MKTITINGKEYEIQCNALTRFNYKKIFGTGIFEDIQRINNFNLEQENKKAELEKQGIAKKQIEKEINNMMLGKLDDILDAIQKIAYIEIQTANPKIESFEAWLSSIEKINLSEPWIAEVTEYAVNSFCG